MNITLTLIERDIHDLGQTAPNDYYNHGIMPSDGTTFVFKDRYRLEYKALVKLLNALGYKYTENEMDDDIFVYTNYPWSRFMFCED